MAAADAKYPEYEVKAMQAFLHDLGSAILCRDVAGVKMLHDLLRKYGLAPWDPDEKEQHATGRLAKGHGRY